MPPDQVGQGLATTLAALTKGSGSELGSIGSELLGLRTSSDLFIGVLHSRTVEDDLGPLGFKDLADSPGLANVGDIRPHVGAYPLVAQLAVDLKEIVLSAFNQQQPLGAEPHGLSADLRPNAPAGAGDEDAFSRQEPLKFRRVQVHRGSPEQVGQLDRLSRPAPQIPAGSE